NNRFNFNTAINAINQLTIMINWYKDVEELDLAVFKEAIDSLLIMLNPFSPHIAEELWQRCGNEDSVQTRTWPKYDPQALIQDEIEVVVQISGKVKERIMVPVDSSEEELREIALNNTRIKELTNGKNIVKIIVVPNKLVNIVAN
ncbi:MAG: class I tRNA ligase family protein, partial [Syntrophomonadaceae bacterium]|nr:class I tRNA ligase family protein [Syntrophomonadaceae bacterium]